VGLQWAAVPARKPATEWAPLHGLQLPSGHLLHHGVLHGLQVDIRSTMPSVGCGRTTCCTMFFTTGSGRISAPVPGVSPPPSSLTLVSEGLFLLHFSHSSPTAAVQHFSPFLKYVITEVPPASLMASAFASDESLLELAGTGSV